MHTLPDLIALCCTCFLGVQSSCDTDGPDSCSFGLGRSCDWTETAGSSERIYVGFKRCLRLTGNPKTRFESNTACSTNAHMHCLEFSYIFKEDDVLDLSVFLKVENLTEKEVWRMSSSDRWDSARVPVNTTSEFKLIFEASSSGDFSVCVDDIDYEEDKCTIMPAAALPPPVTTSSTTLPSTVSTEQTTTFISSEPTITKSPTKKTIMTTITSSVNPVMTDYLKNTYFTNSGDVGTTPSEAGRTAPGGSSSHLGLIVGGVVAAVCLILIGLVLAILVRRKQSHEWKWCFKKQKPKEEDFRASSSHNAVYNVDEAEPDQFINVNANSVIPQNNLQHHGHDMTVTPSPATNYYSVTDEPSDYSYVESNEPKKACSGTLQRSQQGSDESPYEIEDPCTSITHIPTSPEDDYNKLNFHTSSYSDHHHGPVSSTDQNSDYSHLTSKTPSPARDKGPGLYQNSASGWQALNEQAASSLYQNVTGCTDTHQHRTGLPHFPEQDSDLDREDPSEEVYTLPQRKTSESKLFTDLEDEGQNVPASKCHDPGNDVYHVLEEQTPDISEVSSNAKDYQHLDFDGNTVPEERGDDEPAPVYSRLHEGDEDDYHQIDRDHRREVIDGDYSHI